MQAMLPSGEIAKAGTIWEEARALFKLAAPIAAAQAGMALMGLVDTAVVGRVGAGPLGAVGLGNGIFFGLGIVGLGLMMGFDPLVAQAVGANQLQRARMLLVQSGWMALFATALLAIPIALAPLLLEPLGIPREVARDARSFILWRLPGLLPMLLFTGARSYLQGLGRVRALVISTVLANVVNLGLDVLFVFGKGPIPPMGAAGAGIATSLCSTLQFAVLAWAARAAHVGYRGAAVSFRPHLAELRASLQLGLPIGLQLGAETGVFALAGLLAGHLGKVPLAAHQVALSLASFTFCFAVGVGGAGSVRVGWGIGARDQPAVRRSGFVALGAGAGIMSISALLFLFFPTEAARLLSDSPEVVAATAPLLAVAALFQNRRRHPSSGRRSPARRRGHPLLLHRQPGRPLLHRPADRPLLLLHARPRRPRDLVGTLLRALRGGRGAADPIRAPLRPRPRAARSAERYSLRRSRLPGALRAALRSTSACASVLLRPRRTMG